MGAGCNYTNTGDSSVKAMWLSHDVNEDDYENQAQIDAFEFVFDQIAALPKVYSGAFDIQDAKLYYGEWYVIELKSTYGGNGVIIDMDISEYCGDTQGLAEYHFEAVYRKVCKSIGCTLNRATSSYTSCEVKPEDI